MLLSHCVHAHCTYRVARRLNYSRPLASRDRAAGVRAEADSQGGAGVGSEDSGQC